MRSLGSRAMRTVIARWSAPCSADGLVPCICITPYEDTRRWHGYWQAIPRPLVAPEIGLEALCLLEACRNEPVATRLGRRLGKDIGVDIARPSQILRHLAVTGDATPGDCAGPDISGRHLLAARGEEFDFRLCQANFIEEKRIVSTIVEIKKGYRAQQSLLAAECQDAFGIPRKVFAEDIRRHPYSRHQPVRHIGQLRKFDVPSTFYRDIPVGRQ